MENKCLLTTYEGIVSNDKLERFGMIRLKKKLLANPTTGEGYSYTQWCRADGVDGFLSELDGQVYNRTNLPNIDDSLFVPQNGLTFLEIGACVPEFDVSLLKYCHDLTEIRIQGIKGNIDVLYENCPHFVPGTDTSYWVKKPNVSGDIMRLYSRHGSDLRYVSMYDSINLSGNIELLGNCPNINHINVDYCPMITGSLETLVAHWIENGRSTCERMNIGNNMGGVLLNGRAITDADGRISEQTSRKYLSYDSAGNITIEAKLDSGSEYIDITNLFISGN